MDENTETAAPVSTATLRALLLHRLSAEEAGQIEQRLLAEPGFAQVLQDEEYALLDAHAANRLPAEDRAALEQHLLQTVADRQRLRVAIALNRHARAQTSAVSQRPARRRRMAIAGLLAAGCAALAVMLLRSPSSAPVVAVQTPAIPAYTLTLFASVERGSAQRALGIPPDIASVRVQAEIEQPEVSARYRLSVLAGNNAATAPLLRIDDLALISAGRYRYVEAILPAKLFADSAKTIRVEALPPATAFTFDWTVVRGAEADSR